MSARDQLIRILADGQTHSGTALAAAAGVTRSAVWKQAHRLAELGLDLHSERGRGYRISRPLELLDRDRIVAALAPATLVSCEHLQVSTVTGSTSADLVAQPAPRPGHWRAALAEYQTGGRGRRGRRWHCSFGGGLCLSLAWCYAAAPRDLPALSLAAGVAVRRALAAAGAAGVTLKWPNDIVLDGNKLGGILVDVDGDSRGPLRTVIGLGVNLAVPMPLARAVAAEGGLAPAGLDQALGGRTPSRNTLAAGIIDSLVGVLRDFGETGFTPLADEWRRNDFLAGRSVSISSNGNEVAGVARGIAPDGALLVERPEGLAAVFNGDVSLRGDA